MNMEGGAAHCTGCMAYLVECDIVQGVWLALVRCDVVQGVWLVLASLTRT